MSKTAPIKPFNGKPTSSLQGTDISPAQAYKMTNYNERLDKILMGVWHEGYNRCNQEKNHPDGYDNYSYSMNENQAKQAITSLIKELVAEAEADIKLWVDDEVIGSDERHSNGKKMVNYWSCEDCGTPEEAWTRNQLRADQRKRLWLEKFEQNLLKVLGYEDEK